MPDVPLAPSPPRRPRTLAEVVVGALAGDPDLLPYLRRAWAEMGRDLDAELRAWRAASCVTPATTAATTATGRDATGGATTTRPRGGEEGR